MYIENEYFTEQEMQCPCCKVNLIPTVVMSMLIVARYKAGIPFVINSASRCIKHNKEVGGVDDSDHIYGKGFDIKHKSTTDLYAIIKACTEAGFNRFVIHPTFVHVGYSTTKNINFISIKEV